MSDVWTVIGLLWAAVLSLFEPELLSPMDAARQQLEAERFEVSSLEPLGQSDDDYAFRARRDDEVCAGHVIVTFRDHRLVADVVSTCQLESRRAP